MNLRRLRECWLMRRFLSCRMHQLLCRRCSWGRGTMSSMLHLQLKIKVSYSELYSKDWFCYHSMLCHSFICYLKGKHTANFFFLLFRIFIFIKITIGINKTRFLIYNFCTYLKMKLYVKSIG